MKVLSDPEKSSFNRIAKAVPNWSEFKENGRKFNVWRKEDSKSFATEGSSEMGVISAGTVESGD